ncbi:MAG: hypothetical protein AB1486_13045 [Planctomycetota bacterium]
MVNRRQVDCPTFRNNLDALLGGELEAMVRPLFEEHACRCPDCRASLEKARRIETLLSTWDAPQPRPSLAASLIARELAAAAPLTCERSCQLLDLYVDRQLDVVVAARVREHRLNCIACDEHFRAAEDAEQLFELWQAPSPPPEFADRVMARLAVERASALRPPRLHGWRRLALAAALLIATTTTALLLLRSDWPQRSAPAPEASALRPAVVDISSVDLLPPNDPFERYYLEHSESAARARTVRSAAEMVALGGTR